MVGEVEGGIEFCLLLNGKNHILNIKIAKYLILIPTLIICC